MTAIEANCILLASDQGETPSARAITERLAKIRKTAQAGGSASPTKAPSTPINKSSPAKRVNNSKATGSATKRAKTSKVKKEDDSDEVDDDQVDGRDTGNIIKEEEPGVNESPTHRSGRATIKKIDYAQLAGEDAGNGGEETAEETTDAGSNFGQAGGDDD